jgi:hypothetical protein
MAPKCKAVGGCGISTFGYVKDGLCLEHVFVRAGEEGSVAKTRYNAVVGKEGKKTLMTITLGGSRITYKTRECPGKKKPQIPNDIVFDAARHYLPNEMFEDFVKRYEQERRENLVKKKASGTRAAARRSGEYIPNQITKLCRYDPGGNAFCVYRDITGCKSSAFYSINGTPCLECALLACQIEYDEDTCELIIGFEVVSDNLVPSKRAGDWHEIRCRRSKLGFKWNGVRYCLPDDVGALIVNSIPHGDLMYCNTRIYELRSMEHPYKTLLESEDLMSVVKQINDTRSNKHQKMVRLLQANPFPSYAALSDSISSSSARTSRGKDGF